jgi:hypothetical protein
LDDETKASLDARIDDFIQKLSRGKDTTYTAAEAHHDMFHEFVFEYYCKHFHSFPDEKEQEEIGAHISTRQQEIMSAARSLSKFSHLSKP